MNRLFKYSKINLIRKGTILFEFIAITILIIILFAIAAIFPLLGLSLAAIVFFFLIYFNCRLAIIFFVAILICQNIFIATTSVLIKSPIVFNLLQGFHYFIVLVAFFIFLFKKQKLRKIQLIKPTNFLIIFIILASYTLVGIFKYNISSVVVYLRLFSLSIFLFWIGLWFSKKVSFKTFDIILRFLFFALLLSTIIEKVFPENFYAFLQIDKFYAFKYHSNIETDWLDFSSAKDIIEKNNKRFLNIGWFEGIRFLRTGSLIINPVSLGYIFYCMAIYYFYLGKKWISFIAVISIIIFTSAKGPLLASIFTFLLLLVVKFKKVSFYEILLLIIPFTLVIIIIGYKSNNEHILGLFYGLKSMINFPAGHGLGFGGNLSGNVKLESGSESVFGVLFSSLGVLGLIYTLLYVLIIKNIYKVTQSSSANAFCVALIVVFTQGLFQEEAFSTYALGLIMFVQGFIIGDSKIYNEEKNIIFSAE